VWGERGKGDLNAEPPDREKKTSGGGGKCPKAPTFTLHRDEAKRRVGVVWPRRVLPGGRMRRAACGCFKTLKNGEKEDGTERKTAARPRAGIGQKPEKQNIAVLKICRKTSDQEGNTTLRKEGRTGGGEEDKSGQKIGKRANVWGRGNSNSIEQRDQRQAELPCKEFKGATRKEHYPPRPGKKEKGANSRIRHPRGRDPNPPYITREDDGETTLGSSCWPLLVRRARKNGCRWGIGWDFCLRSRRRQQAMQAITKGGRKAGVLNGITPPVSAGATRLKNAGRQETGMFSTRRSLG